MILDANVNKKRDAQIPVNSKDIFDERSNKYLSETLSTMQNEINEKMALNATFAANGNCTLTAKDVNALIKATLPTVLIVAEGALFSPLYLLVLATATDVYTITFALAEPDETDGYAISEYSASSISYPASSAITFTKLTF